MYYTVDAESGKVLGEFWQRRSVPPDWWLTDDAHHIPHLLYRLMHSTDELERRRILTMEDLLAKPDPRVEAVLTKMLSPRRTEVDYYIATYLADKGNKDALAILASDHPWAKNSYPISSCEMCMAIAAFGKWKYRPPFRS